MKRILGALLVAALLPFGSVFAEARVAKRGAERLQDSTFVEGG
jgi:hypothetical protein